MGIEAIEPAFEGRPERCERCRHFYPDEDFPFAGRCYRWTWVAGHWVDVDHEDSCPRHQPAYPSALRLVARVRRMLEGLLLVLAGRGREADDETGRAAPRLLAHNLTTGAWGERRSRLYALHNLGALHTLPVVVTPQPSCEPREHLEPAVIAVLHELAAGGDGAFSARVAQLLLQQTADDPRVIDLLFAQLAAVDDQQRALRREHAAPRLSRHRAAGARRDR
jgi:hypothetical protein